MSKRNIWLRRICQTIFFFLWVFLFWQTAHQDVGPFPPDLFLVTNPLVATLAMAAARVWVSAALYSLVLIGLTLIFGRFFCGWVCPLGTLFDVVGRLWRGRAAVTLKNDRAWRRVKFYFLAALCVGAVAGGQLVYWGDPLVFSFRGIAMGFIPSAESESAFLAFAMLLIIIGLCGVTHRFWCRYLCPLGAFYAVVARFSIFRRRLKGCDSCKAQGYRECQQGCAMGASPKRQGSPDECIRCMSCQGACRLEAPKFIPSLPLPTTREHLMDLDRRSFVFSLGAGAITGVVAVQARSGSDAPWRIVRPPMIADEVAFMALCVRCGQCVRSCPSGTLQPLFLEAGFAGIWTPAITPRVGGCVDNCNACATTCPTGAIPKFGPTRPEKWAVKMGHVMFDPQHCISYAHDAVKPCLKCVEVCPNKAIVVDEASKPARPTRVIYDRCIGCGTCETECRKVVVGQPALVLTNTGAGEPAALVVDPKPKLPEHAGNQEK
ncbi:MAG: 4Fe-4S binding protein [Myxococcota bacterium]|nr:4Fe-4S binding protein [Myxococcota bacterium]